MTLACTIDATGIHRPDFATVKAGIESIFRDIYGSDIYIEPDSQDGQLIAALAAVLNDCNAACVATYNAFAPSTAVGNGLSSVVKVNGIARKVASYSTADLVVVGQAGTAIFGGIVADQSGGKWLLPEVVIVPAFGEIVVSARSENIGANAASANTITEIVTPTRGWQSATNPAPAVLGAPVEKDDQLRIRQSISTENPSHSLLEGLIGSVASLPDVTHVGGVENDTNVTSPEGLPAHSVALVVDGGDAQSIARTIFAKKGAGVATYGGVEEEVSDAYGIARKVRFFRPEMMTIGYTISIRPLRGYLVATEDAIRQSLVDWTNSLGIGGSVYHSRAYSPALLAATSVAKTFEIVSLSVWKAGVNLGGGNANLAFWQAPKCSLDDVIVSLVA